MRAGGARYLNRGRRRGRRLMGAERGILQKGKALKTIYM
jgi:hypothetical protein